MRFSLPGLVTYGIKKQGFSHLRTMERALEQTQTSAISLQRDLWSKLIDGVVPAVILVMLWMVVSLAIKPVQQNFGQPGLLVYTLGLLAVAMFALQHAVQERYSVTFRAWYGIAGGFLAWAVIEVSAFMTSPSLTSASGLIVIIMTTLIVSILWHNGLPFGAKFFVVTFMMNWAEHVLMDVENYLSGFSPIFALGYRLTGYAAVVGTVIAVVYILFHSKRRIDRICAALAVWFLFSLSLYVFRGGLY